MARSPTRMVRKQIYLEAAQDYAPQALGRGGRRRE